MRLFSTIHLKSAILAPLALSLAALAWLSIYGFSRDQKLHLQDQAESIFQASQLMLERTYGRSYLKRFPIDRLKIDRSFVIGVDANEEDASLVQAIIAMAHGLNLSVIAEGVDTAAQIDYLKRHGCEQIQGYFFSRPVETEKLTEMLLAGRTLADANGEAA